MKKLICLISVICIIICNITVMAEDNYTTKQEEFFFCMKEGSEFVYIGEDENILFRPMIASNNAIATPKIFNGRTYLPFRYLFEEMLGFQELKDSSVQLGEKQFRWYNDENGDITITYKLNEKIVELKAGNIFEYNGETMDVIKLENGTNYIPLRYFEKENLCYLNWNENRKDICLASSETEFNKYYNSRIAQTDINHNYTTYSDIFETPDGMLKNSLSSCIDEDVYSVSTNYSLGIYSNNEYKVNYIEFPKVTDSNSKTYWKNITPGQELEFYNSNGEKIDILVDRVVIYEDKIYGLKITLDRNYIGTLFTAKLSVDSTDNGYKIKAVNYQELTGSHVVMFDIQKKDNILYCYYVDVADDYSLKRINVENGYVENILCDGKNLKNIDYFSIGKEQIAFYDFYEQCIKIGNCIDGVNVTDVAHVAQEENIKFINYSKVDDKFFYVSLSEGRDDIIKLFGAKSRIVEEGSFGPSGEIKNIAVFNSGIYAIVNGNFLKLND